METTRLRCIWLLGTLFLTLLTLDAHANVVFADISVNSGLKRSQGPRKKYGGASLADLDGDGNIDIVTVHHDKYFAQVYFGRGDGTFEPNSWGVWDDNHAISPTRFYAWNNEMSFVLTRGGSWGLNPNHMLMFHVKSNRQIVDGTKEAGMISYIHGRGRGRSAVFMNLRWPGIRDTWMLDMVLTNAEPLDGAPGGGIQHWGYQSNQARFLPRNLTGDYRFEFNEYVTVTDVENDGRMELVSFENLRIYGVKKKGFQFELLNNALLPKISYRGTIAVAEFDFDNDGYFDLYIARTNSGNYKWIKNNDNQDRLLKNMGGKYYKDVSSDVGLPKGGFSTGVTTGDFDNDGFTDVLLSRYDKPDLVLRNIGGKKFVAQDASFNRKSGIPGDMSTAADLNNDGKLDLVVSEGHWHENSKGGYYRIMKNITPNVGNYLLVRVLSSPSYKSTSQYAVAKLSLGNGALKLMRRVGSPGTAVSISYIETLHFGVGKYTTADSLTVEWRDGYVQTFTNVKMGRYMIVGRSSWYNSAQ